ncbi:hypothetical protein L202_06116 [Cryptococcus amylolentus CBS 6039]|uniref:Asparagine synthetase domain-containing protein n=2 Tax=Cryptococcus amylolentus TaxID=104669 RepID=A0A1E3HJ81_9TREE|nr:hypothetical protein L202_06116 [Cryptococcus amylolentus CBS 6039]ODN76195.1 hypothetical protein L202_06116 [Cryptococcus amylolentus CBS 6039]ODN96321.1 hypothetical protein I350_08345 [Cryptococcus amylolentus CBS 6273]
MCGLTLAIRPSETAQSGSLRSIEGVLSSTIKCRGPDCQGSFSNTFATSTEVKVEVSLHASVLGLRGDLTSQPRKGKRGVLGWNGQVFEGLDVKEGENDTQKIFEQLEDGASFDEILQNVEGPFACIYIDLEMSVIHYQLDPLSRRSLLAYPASSDAKTDMFILSSCFCGEARAKGIDMRALLGGEGGRIDLGKIQLCEDGQLDFSKALTLRTDFDLPESSSTPWTRVTPINPTLPHLEGEGSCEPSIDAFIDHLRTSVRHRVENIPNLQPDQSKVAVLFSGGIDCTFLAYLIHQCLPVDKSVDLINVSFAPAPSRVDTGKGKNKAPPQPVDAYKVPDRISGLEAWEELRQVCPGRDWRFVEVNVPYDEAREHRDRIVELMYPSITEMDLSLAYPLYFASLGHGSLRHADGTTTPYHVTAKVYISGLGADEQLGGYSRHRHAFNTNSWQGLIDEVSHTLPLIDIIKLTDQTTQMDIHRLPTRNLSRDDRLISSHARDARYPFLSLSFISHLSSVPIHIKCDPRLPPGEGDKRLLRLAAKKVGLDKTSGRVKRAMQFGTRSSKVGGSGRGVKGPKAGEREVS